MKATLGRIVIAKNLPSNGADEQPAIINGVWSEGTGPLESDCVNVMVLPDCGVPECRTSVYLFADRARAEEYIAQQTKDYPLSKPFVCFWPDRV